MLKSALPVHSVSPPLHERFDRASRYFRSNLDTERDMEIEPDPFAAT
jgi:hypothetical protein